MPPKKAKQSSATIIDGVDTSEMNREKLEQFTMRVKEELDREREERNYFQLERDKIRTFWEITRTKLDEVRAENRNKDREIEECIEASEAATKAHNQHVKHLAYEQMGERCALKADAQAALRNAHAEYAAREGELLRDKRELQAKLHENEIAGKEEMRRIKLLHHEELNKIRTEFEHRALELEGSSDSKLQATIKELSIVRLTDLAEVEERKNKQLDDLVKSHEKAFADLKNYYDDITLNNLGLISSLKTQMEETLRLKERADKAATDAIAEGKKMAEPLKRALDEVADLKRRAHYYERDRAALASKTRILTSLEKQHVSLKWNHEILKQRFDQVVMERDNLKDKFGQAILELQQRAALRGALLEQRIHEMNGSNTNTQS